MQIEVGAILEGKVTGLTGFGAFIELPGGRTGMVHISEVAATYVKDIKDHLKEGQTVKVKVLNIDPSGKISLSIKQALDPEEIKQQQSASRSSYGNNNDRKRYPPRRANTWQGQKQSDDSNLSFEDMMSKFKKQSDEKLVDLKRSTEGKTGGPSHKGRK